MDSAGIIHRVLENKESLLELHSVDGAPFDFTYKLYLKQFIYSPYLWQWQQREPHIWSIEKIVQSCTIFPIVVPPTYTGHSDRSPALPSVFDR